MGLLKSNDTLYGSIPIPTDTYIWIKGHYCTRRRNEVYLEDKTPTGQYKKFLETTLIVHRYESVNAFITNEKELDSKSILITDQKLLSKSLNGKSLYKHFYEYLLTLEEYQGCVEHTALLGDSE